MRVRPQRIVIEHGGGPEGQPLRAEIDPANMPADVATAISRLLDETRPAAPPDTAEVSDTEYDVLLDYGDRSERLRYAEAELPAEVRAALDSRLRR